MWGEIRQQTTRHLYRGYWSALKVERASPKGLPLKSIFLVFSPPMAARTQIVEKLKSPNWNDKAFGPFLVDVLLPGVEDLKPRGGLAVLRRTPVVTAKTTQRRCTSPST